MKMCVRDCLCVSVVVLFGLLHACLCYEDQTREDLKTDDNIILQTHECDVRSEDVKFQVSGRALVPGVRTQDWISSARVLLDGDKHVGFIRARVVNYIKTSEVIRLPYPLQMRSTGLHSYFIQRETWGWSDVLMNPMVLMMALPLLIIVLLPKVFSSTDPEMRREMEQSMNMLNPNHELPDVSELMTNFFSPPKSHRRLGGGARSPRGGAPIPRGGAPRRK
ncbi:ER membrane protein complex subunit 7-like isoform X2 [Myxocyprinus asiaticus]|uniref:ER membrane protein complex subunit 7-like isoform X2 n=1 Tax=Myxocyprinus asiaticus TaxID=70543 RepID=UPI002221E7D1|nr:ER membrane protein complex subunit 7-like isoform X2 [Myxocyprinus asiaticus]